jgi:hypothetical protein
MTRIRSWVKRLAVPFANHMVYASDAYVSLKSSINDLSPSLVACDRDVGGDADARLQGVVRMLRPVSSTSLGFVRVGAHADGGYVMASPIEAVGAISVGVGPDVSWDRDISSRGIPVALFDHTIRRLPGDVPRGTFHRVGIGPVPTVRTKPLASLVETADLPHAGDLLLKMDVEGAEWAVLSADEPPDLEPFSQVVIELHGLSQLRDPGAGLRVTRAITHLTSQHLPIHVHANNYDGLSRFDDWWFPNSIEVSLIRKDLLPDFSPARALRSDLDSPCDPRVSEIDLSGLLRERT